jgi:arylsulfatase A-like enzyme
VAACTSASPLVDSDAGAIDAATDASTNADTATTARRNVLLVILDDVGAEEIRSYAKELAAINRAKPTSVGILDANKNSIPDGLEDTNGDGHADGAIETPTIDSLASAGVRFTQAWANPVCSPTRAGIYSGRYVVHHSVGAPIGNPNTGWALPHDIQTLPEALKKDGSPYKMGLFGKWHLGSIDGTLPTDRGWDYFSGVLGGAVTDYYKWNKVVVDEARKRTNTTSTAYATTDAIDDALAWINTQDAPWWATVALNAAHTPYVEPPAGCLSGKLTGTDDVSLYHKALECADRELGRLFEGLGAAKLANTTVVFIGDNGTETGTSQVYAQSHSKSSMYQGGVHVPLIVADGATLTKSQATSGVGAVTEPGRTVTAPVHAVDLFSTLGAIMGATATSTDSVSMAGYLSSTSASAARTLVYTDAFGVETADLTKLKASLSDPALVTAAQFLALGRINVRAAIRSEQYKLVYEKSSYQLFDLSNDPLEQLSIWCTGAAKTQSEELAAAMAAIDKQYPASKCP